MPFVPDTFNSPWLILTDKDHIVTAEGLNFDELDSKIGQAK